MKYPPILTDSQKKTINDADFAQVYVWYNELLPGIKANNEVNKMYNYLNEVMKEKA